MSSSTLPLISEPPKPLQPEEILAEEPQGNQGATLLHRVLWSSYSQRRLVLFDLLPEAQLRQPYWENLDDIEGKLHSGQYVRTTLNLPSYMLVRDDEYQNDPQKRARLERHIAVRERRWNVVASLLASELEPQIYLPSVRGPLVARIARDHHITHKAVLRLLYLAYKFGRFPNALLPQWLNCGAPGTRRQPGAAKRGRPAKLVTTGHAVERVGVNVDDEMQKTILRGVDLYCGRDDRVPISRAYRLTKEKFFCSLKECGAGVYERVPLPAHVVPTLRQFRYYAEIRLRQMDFVRRRIGENTFLLTSRGLTGSVRSNLIGPGQVYEIDSTIADVYLISRYNPDWIIGRPVIYVVIDSFSRLIVGLYIGLIGPSWEGASLAVANALSGKVAFCAAHGYTITEAQWPAHHIPHSIVADRGELVSKAAEEALRSLRINLGVPPPYRPDWKPIVERRFRILNDECIDWTPGAVRQRQCEMRKRSYLEDATLDIEDFTRVIIACALEQNLHTRREDLLTKEMIADGVEPYSVPIWHWGVSNLTGPLRVEEPDLVRTHLLPSDQATVTARGILYKKLTYSCPTAMAEGWFDRARRFGTWSVDIRREYTTDRIHLAPPSVSKFEECQLLDREERYANMRFEEAIDCIEYLRLQGSDVSDRDERGRIALRRQATSIVQGAQARRRDRVGRPSKQQQLIREQRDNEATMERALSSRKPKQPDSGVTHLPNIQRGSSSLPDDAPDKMIEILKAQRRAKWGTDK